MFFEFDNEIVSEQFGNYWSILIKGCIARLFPNSNNVEAYNPDRLHKGIMDEIIRRGTLDFIEHDEDDHKDK